MSISNKESILLELCVRSLIVIKDASIDPSSSVESLSHYYSRENEAKDGLTMGDRQEKLHDDLQATLIELFEPEELAEIFEKYI